MTDIDRRGFVGAGALGLAALLPGTAAAQSSPSTQAATAATPPPDVTRTLAAYVVKSRPADLPAPVRSEACRTLLNWAGCAVGGSRHETGEITIRALAPFAGPPQATLLGRRERI